MAPLLTLLALGGPFSSLPEYCAAEMRQNYEELRDCAVTRESGASAIVELRYAGGQRAGMIAVRAPRGWFVTQETVLWDGNRDRGTFTVVALRNPPGVVLRAVQSHWEKPRESFVEAAYYQCFLVEVSCRVDGPEPRCAGPIRVAGRRDCEPYDERVPSRWDWRRTRSSR